MEFLFYVWFLVKLIALILSIIGMRYFLRSYWHLKASDWLGPIGLNRKGTILWILYSIVILIMISQLDWFIFGF